MALRRAPSSHTGDVVVGRARVDRRTKDLVKRLQPGEVAVIDHRDIDRVAADALVEAGAAAVVNASPSISGRYPNGGPIRIIRAAIPLVDDVGKDLMGAVAEGDLVEVDGATVRARGEVVATGTVLDGPGIEAAMEQARSRIGVELESFAQNT